MQDNLRFTLETIGIDPTATIVVSAIVLIIVLTALFIHFFLHKIVLSKIKKIDAKQPNFITRSLLEFNLFKRMALVFQSVIIYWQVTIWIDQKTNIYNVLQMITDIFIVMFVLLSLFSIVDRIFKILFLKTKIAFFAMQGIVQSIKLILFIIFCIYIISVLADKSPVVILSGLGAMSAVLMLVFKDTILGFTAGLQLSTNKMVQVGDWIEIPKYGADGDVIDIGLNTVKVRNWDKTITTIPTYALISDSFKNWRGMKDSGGRRIKRSILLNVHSIRFLDRDDYERLLKASFLSDYLKSKEQEIKKYNQEKNIDLSIVINGRRLTNIGTLRAYILFYLKNHPKIHQGMTLMVRQLSPNQFGLPLEVYCFTNTTAWTEYESIQSDIFDHIFAVLKEFKLTAYQSI